MYKMRSGTSKESPKALLIGPGAIYKDFVDLDNLGVLLGATKGGNTFRINQEIHSSEVDGALGPIKGMQWVTKLIPELETNLLAITKDNLQLSLANMQLADSNDDYVKLTQDGSLADSGYRTIAIVGEISGSAKPVIVVVKDAMAMDPVEVPFGTGKDDVVLKLKFVGHYQPDDQYGVPYEIYYPKSLVDPNDIPVFTVSNPVIAPAGGTFNSPQVVQATCSTEGSTIYYSTDGSDPKTGGIVYNGPITVNQSGTLKIVAKAQGVYSGVVTVNFTINTAIPTILPNGGTFDSIQTITLECPTAGALIYYTTDGTDPDVNSTLYDGPFQLASNCTVKAMAVKTPADPSGITSAIFLINLPYTVAPVINPAGGTFDGGAYVTMSSATAGAVIYYTTDGSDPRVSGTKKLYGGQILIAGTVTIMAYATKNGVDSDTVTTADFIVNNPLVAPSFQPNSGAFAGSVNVVLSTTTENAQLFYTVDGTDPKVSPSAIQYLAPINITTTTTIMAYTKYNNLKSAVVEQEYIIT